MIFKKMVHSKKQKQHTEKAEQETNQKALPPEELRRISMEMSLGCGMVPPGCFPDGIWYFY